jgi:hypothetical protein
MGRYEEAVIEANSIKLIDPVWFETGGMSSNFYWARHYDEAIELAKREIELVPNSVGGHLWLGTSLRQIDLLRLLWKPDFNLNPLHLNVLGAPRTRQKRSYDRDSASICKALLARVKTPQSRSRPPDRTTIGSKRLGFKLRPKFLNPRNIHPTTDCDNGSQ